VSICIPSISKGECYATTTAIPVSTAATKAAPAPALLALVSPALQKGADYRLRHPRPELLVVLVCRQRQRVGCNHHCNTNGDPGRCSDHDQNRRNCYAGCSKLSSDCQRRSNRYANSHTKPNGNTETDTKANTSGSTTNAQTNTETLANTDAQTALRWRQRQSMVLRFQFGEFDLLSTIRILQLFQLYSQLLRLG